jgi:hypothetical protein
VEGSVNGHTRTAVELAIERLDALVNVDRRALGPYYQNVYVHICRFFSGWTIGSIDEHLSTVFSRTYAISPRTKCSIICKSFPESFYFALENCVTLRMQLFVLTTKTHACRY